MSDSGRNENPAPDSSEFQSNVAGDVHAQNVSARRMQVRQRLQQKYQLQNVAPRGGQGVYMNPQNTKVPAFDASNYPYSDMLAQNFQGFKNCPVVPYLFVDHVGQSQGEGIDKSHISPLQGIQFDPRTSDVYPAKSSPQVSSLGIPQSKAQVPTCAVYPMQEYGTSSDSSQRVQLRPCLQPQLIQQGPQTQVCARSVQGKPSRKRLQQESNMCSEQSYLAPVRLQNAMAHQQALVSNLLYTGRDLEPQALDLNSRGITRGQAMRDRPALQEILVCSDPSGALRVPCPPGPYSPYGSFYSHSSPRAAFYQDISSVKLSASPMSREAPEGSLRKAFISSRGCLGSPNGLGMGPKSQKDEWMYRKGDVYPEESIYEEDVRSRGGVYKEGAYESETYKDGTCKESYPRESVHQKEIIYPSESHRQREGEYSEGVNPKDENFYQNIQANPSISGARCSPVLHKLPLNYPGENPDYSPRLNAGAFPEELSAAYREQYSEVSAEAGMQARNPMQYLACPDMSAEERANFAALRSSPGILLQRTLGQKQIGEDISQFQAAQNISKSPIPTKRQLMQEQVYPQNHEGTERVQFSRRRVSPAPPKDDPVQQRFLNQYAMSQVNNTQALHVHRQLYAHPQHPLVRTVPAVQTHVHLQNQNFTDKNAQAAREEFLIAQQRHKDFTDKGFVPLQPANKTAIVDPPQTAPPSASPRQFLDNMALHNFPNAHMMGKGAWWPPKTRSPSSNWKDDPRQAQSAEFSNKVFLQQVHLEGVCCPSGADSMQKARRPSGACQQVPQQGVYWQRLAGQPRVSGPQEYAYIQQARTQGVACLRSKLGQHQSPSPMSKLGGTAEQQELSNDQFAHMNTPQKGSQGTVDAPSEKYVDQAALDFGLQTGQVKVEPGQGGQVWWERNRVGQVGAPSGMPCTGRELRPSGQKNTQRMQARRDVYVQVQADSGNMVGISPPQQNPRGTLNSAKASHVYAGSTVGAPNIDTVPRQFLEPDPPPIFGNLRLGAPAAQIAYTPTSHIQSDKPTVQDQAFKQVPPVEKQKTKSALSPVGERSDHTRTQKGPISGRSVNPQDGTEGSVVREAFDPGRSSLKPLRDRSRMHIPRMVLPSSKFHFEMSSTKREEKSKARGSAEKDVAHAVDLSAKSGDVKATPVHRTPTSVPQGKRESPKDLLLELSIAAQMGYEAELHMLMFRSSFLVEAMKGACKIVKHGGGKCITAKDIQLELEQNWNVHIPVAPRPKKPVRRSTPSTAYLTCLAAVQKSKQADPVRTGNFSESQKNA